MKCSSDVVLRFCRVLGTLIYFFLFIFWGGGGGAIIFISRD